MAGTVIPFQPADSPAIPAACFRGAFQDYRRALAETTEASDNYHFLGLAVVAGLIIGRRAYLEHGRPIYPNLYACIVGETGHARKSTAISHARRLLADFEEIYTLTTGSWEGILDALDGDRRRVLLVPGEYRSLAAKAGQESTSNLIPGLTEAYDCPAELSHRTRGKDLRTSDPFLSIFTSSTRDWLQHSFQALDVAGGFVNRWTFVDGTPKPPNPLPARPDDSLWGEVRKALRDMDEGIDVAPDSRRLELSPEAREVFVDFYRDLHEAKHGTELLAQLAQRLQDQALKLALLYALLEGCDYIRQEHMAAGTMFASWELHAQGRIFEGFGEGKQRKLETRVLKLLTARGPGMLKRDLHQAIGGRYSAGEFNQAVNALGRMGVVDFRGRRSNIVQLVEEGRQQLTKLTEKQAPEPVSGSTLTDCW